MRDKLEIFTEKLLENGYDENDAIIQILNKKEFVNKIEVEIYGIPET